MISKELCPIDWSDSAQNVHNKVRGLQTWPCALTKLDGKNIKIHKTKLSDYNGAKAGEIVDSSGRIIVSCGDGKCLEILTLQPEGKKAMPTKAFLAGNKIEKGTVLGE